MKEKKISIDVGMRRSPTARVTPLTSSIQNTNDLKPADILSKLSAENLKKSIDIYRLHFFIFMSIPSVDFQPLEGWSEAVKPSYLVAEILDDVGIDPSIHTPDVISFALLLIYFHHDFLVDLSKSSPASISALLSQELIKGSLRYPEYFGRTLYDKFNDELTFQRSESLIPSLVDNLLEGTDQGVYQLGNFVTGPLGIIQSLEERYLPPTKKLPLWHCEDTGCGKLHTVTLQRYTKSSFALAKKILSALTRKHGPETDWDVIFGRLNRRGNASVGREYYDIAGFIADCIVDSDRDLLFSELMRSKRGDLIRKIAGGGRNELTKGKPEEISKRLSQLSKLQVMLAVTDADLVFAIDKLVKSKKLKIPPAETRKSKFKPPTVLVFDQPCTMSVFGIRSDREYPALFLSSEIHEAYTGINQIEDLVWRCEKFIGVTDKVSNFVLDYIAKRGPGDAIKNLVLPSKPVSLSISERLHFIFDPHEHEDEQIDRLLWKFGFSPPRFDTKYRRLHQQLEDLKNDLISYRSHLSEDDRDKIRSKGVNIFVSFENVIEEIVSYNIWCLSTDHFLGNRFSYSFKAAVNCVSRVLGATIVVSDHEFRWNPKGGNVLSVLLVYARAAVKWMQSLLKAEKVSLERHENEIPHFDGELNQQFRFRHTELWADAGLSQLEEFYKSFDALITDFEQSRIAEIRNGLDHYRDEDQFPSLDAIIVCEARLSSALRAADINRFLPKYFWLSHISRDAFGLVEFILRDHADRKISIRGPFSSSGLASPSFQRPVVVPFGNLLGASQSALFFDVVEESSFSRFWNDYPRRPTLNNEPDEPDLVSMVSEDESLNSAS